MIRLQWLIDWHHRNHPPYAAAVAVCGLFLAGVLLCQ